MCESFKEIIEEVIVVSLGHKKKNMLKPIHSTLRI